MILAIALVIAVTVTISIITSKKSPSEKSDAAGFLLGAGDNAVSLPDGGGAAGGRDGQNNSMTTQTKTAPSGAHVVAIETDYGVIKFETYDTDAPRTVKNFLTLAEKGFYDNLIFHRVISGFMIQGGDPKGNGTGGPGYTFPDELNPEAESYKKGYKKGVVAMANAGPDTNGSQFFIMLEDYPLPKNYTIFGKVVSGQDAVDKIGAVITGANDKPLSPVIMKKATVGAK